jgi:hypothetical protein
MKKILLTLVIMAIAVMMFAASTPSSTYGKSVNNMGVYWNTYTIVAADSTTNGTAYGASMPSGTFSGDKLCGKFVTFSLYIVTAPISQSYGAANGSTYSYLFPRIYGSLDGTTWFLVGNYNYTYSTAKTAATYFTFVADLRAVSIPYIQVRYYLASSTYVEANTAALIDTGAIKVTAVVK